MARRSPFPPVSIEEALILAQTIWEQNAGNPMRRVTIFDVLNRQPESSTSRALITASAGYGLTEGSYKSDLLALTELGRNIVENNDANAMLAAVIDVELFKLFYERYKDATVPSRAAALDFLKSQGIIEKSAENCLEIILKNGRQVGLIQEISSKERIVSIDHAQEKLSKLDIPFSRSETIVPEEQESDNYQNNRKTEVVEHQDKTLSPNLYPTLHIDIQVHISADAKTEQIDQIFASMAKHLYSKAE